jgi:hypothetical protein
VAAKKASNKTMPPAGAVSIVLSVNQQNYTKAMGEAQKQLDTLAGKAKTAGSSTVTSMQAASASIRLLDNPLTMNVRALERFATQSKLVGQIFQAAFPVVGAIAAISVVTRLGTEVVKFVKEASEMPKAINQGFASLALSSKTSTDQLQLTNDLLQNSINKLENKPQNNQKIAIDEARLAMDKFAESIEAGNSKLEALLSKNHLSGWHELMFTSGSADREGTTKYFSEQANKNAYDLANSAPGSPEEAKAKKALLDTQNAQLAEAQKDLQKQIYLSDAKDTRTPQAIDRGIITNILNEQKRQAAQEKNSTLVPEEKAAKVAHDAALKAAEARRKAAAEFLKMLELDGEIAQKWKAYEDENAKIFAADNLEKYKTNFLSGADSKSLSDQGNGAKSYITSLRDSINLNKENADAIALASLQMSVQTGQMTALTAAQVLANIHTENYKDDLQDLKDQRDAIAKDPQYNNNELARQAALQDNSNRISGLNRVRGIQVAEDSQSINPAASSGFVGATNALNDFVLASRDASTQMREFTTSTINGFNDVVLKIMTTRSTGLENRMALGNYGAGLARSVAGMGLQKVEGTVLGSLGFGGKPDGSQGKPLYVRIADAAQSAIGSAGGLFGKFFGGNSGSSGPGASGLASAMNISSSALASDQAGGGIGTIASTLVGMLPFLASGGPINGPAIVGEQGPELFIPTSNGTIVPNHKLSSSSSSSGANTTHFNIDARGSNDPAQVNAQIHRALTDAAPMIAAHTMKAMQENKARRPMSSH